MRIGSFNLESLGTDARSGAPLDERAAVLRPQLERLRADMLCLQELNAARLPGAKQRRLGGLDLLLEGGRYAGFHRAATEAPETGRPVDRHNLATLSRWPILARRQYLNDLVAGPRYRLATADPPETDSAEIRWDRPILHVTIGLPGGELLHVINLHLRAPLAAPVPGQKAEQLVWKSVSGWAEGFFLASVKRSGQALEARLIIDRIFDAEREPCIVVTGDFNAEGAEVPVRTIRGDVADSGNARLAPRSLVVIDRAIPESQRFSVLHGGRRLMLDHMLISRPLLSRYRQIEVHNEALSDELFPAPGGRVSPESYHAPLVAEFDFGD